MGWNVTPCAAQGCALAAEHEGEHRTVDAVERQQQRTGPWRLLLLVVVAAVAYLVVNGWQG